MLRTFLPHVFTLGNLLAGCAGLVYCLSERIVPEQLQEADPQGSELLITLSYSSRLHWASFMIFLAAVLDFLDGWIARRLGAESELGKLLDSLADVVTFGVLPACIVFQLLMASWSREPDALYVPMALAFPAFALALAAAWRLARFSIQRPQQQRFSGLPTPAMGLLVATLPLVLFTNNLNLAEVVINKWFLYALTALLSVLMVSSLPMFSLKFAHYGWRGNQIRYLFLLVSAVLIAGFAYAGLGLAVAGYILLNGLLYFTPHQFLKANTDDFSSRD